MAATSTTSKPHKIQLISSNDFKDTSLSEQEFAVGLSPTTSASEASPADAWWGCRELASRPLSWSPDEPPTFNVSYERYANICRSNEAIILCNLHALDNENLSDTGIVCAMENLQFDHQFPTGYSYPIYGVMFPILVILALIANIGVVLVLSKKHMQSPTNTVLLYMAVAELFVGLVPIPFTFYWFSLRYFETPYLLTTPWCYVYHYLFDALPPICHSTAIWLTVLLAAQRYVYIQHPVRAQTWCTVQNVRRASIVIVVVSIVCCSMKFGDKDYEAYRGYIFVDNGVQFVTGICLTQFSPIVEAFGAPVYYVMFFWLRSVLFVWLPSLLLICLNIMLIKAIHEAQQRRDRLLSESKNREASRQKESNNTSTMLVVIVSIFLLVNLPQGIAVVAVTIDEVLVFNMPFFLQDGGGSLFFAVDNMLILATYPLNFFIYCSMSTQFRETFKRLFCANLPPLPLSRRTSSYNTFSYTPVGHGVNNGTDKATLNEKLTKLNTKVNSAMVKENNGAEENNITNNLLENERVSDTCV